MEHEFAMVLLWAVIVTITLGILVMLVLKLGQKHDLDIRKMEASITKERKDATDQARNILKGKIGEQISPLLPDFYSKYEPSDARFLGSPIDFVIFKNMSKFDKIKKDTENPIEVILMDVKTGKKGLEPLQTAIKRAVEDGRVEFDVLRPKIE